ncbi:MAG: LacI family DNA-binding transcriptional regulator [Deinococcales bacterium]
MMRDKRAVTIFDVARASGVSYSTVSRVLNGFAFVKESTRQKVLNTAEKMGYVANLQARSLAGGKSQVIGLVIPNLDEGYVNSISSGIDEALTKANYDLMIYTNKYGKEAKYVNSIIHGPSDGLILLVPLIPSSYLDTLRHKHFPHVLIDQIDPSAQSSSINSSNFQGAYEATSYLISLGHRRIGFIGGIPEIHSAQERLKGYKQALSDHQLAWDESLIQTGNFQHQLAYENSQKLLNLSPPPSAIFASNDLSAFGAMEAIRERGLNIPEDISLIGFDDIPQASISYPKLSTVRQPLKEMGKLAVEMLLAQLEQKQSQPQQVILTTKLVIRDSCKGLI